LINFNFKYLLYFIQQNCNKLFDNQSFIKSHFNNCNVSKDSVTIANPNDKLKIKILKGVLNKDELGKPCIDYITEVNYNTQMWRINRKFNQFANLHKSLRNLMGEDFKFPDSSNIFIKIVENSNFHENKIKYLEAYVREISDIPVISNSKIFRRFFDFHLNTEENIYENNMDIIEKESFIPNYNRKSNLSKSGYKSDHSDSNYEDTKINYFDSAAYKKDLYSIPQKNNFYPDNEGKITFENTYTYKNKAGNNNSNYNDYN